MLQEGPLHLHLPLPLSLFLPLPLPPRICCSASTSLRALSTRPPHWVRREPRQVEVRFKCGQDSHNVIVSIKERTTCSYVLDFFTPLVCSHPSFQTTQDPLRSIDCYPERQEPVVA